MQSGTGYAFATDNVGSVTSVIGSNGTTEATYAYDPYGNMTTKSGTDIGDNLIEYTGELSDTGTGASTLYTHDGNRWYSPNAGSFTAQDTNSFVDNPGDGNRYAYAADNPVNYTDPTGQNVWGDVVGGVLAIGGLAVLVAGAFAEIPIVTVLGAIGVVAGAGIWIYQMECKYGNGTMFAQQAGICAFVS